MTKHISEVEVSAWVDRQLDPVEMGQVESHIRVCSECRAAADEMSALVEAFRSAEAAELPPYLWGRIAASLEKAALPRTMDLRSWRMPVLGRPLWMRAAAAVLAVMILAAGGAIYIEHRSAAEFEQQALAEMQLAQNNLAALEAVSYNPFRTAGAAISEENPFLRDQLRPDVNPFRSASGGR
jgi:anti-sigma factor RsiW